MYTGRKDAEMLKECIDNLREKAPLIHNITNYVTVNDVANIILACGASPIMADEIEEVEEITSICNGLNINIGTLNARTIPAMMAAGKKAEELNHVILLDPVGAGASTLRTNTALKLMEQIKFTVIRGNMSEIKALHQQGGDSRGVDVCEADKVTEDNIQEAALFLQQFSKQHACVPVCPVGQFAEYIRSNHQRCFRKAAADKCMGGIQCKYKSGAGRADIIAGCINRPDHALNLAGPIGETVIR